MKTIKVIGLFLVLMVMGCTSSKITSSWIADNVTPKDYNKILVLCLTREADRSIQDKMENHFVSDLKGLGYNAVTSLSEYGPKVFEKMDEEAAISKLKNSGVDAVITIVLLDKKKERKYVPGNIYATPYSYYYSSLWGYRSTLYRRIYEPGYYVTNTKYFWESNFYDMSTTKMLYSVQTQSFDSDNSEMLGHEYGRKIVNNMVKQHVLKGPVN